MVGVGMNEVASCLCRFLLLSCYIFSLSLFAFCPSSTSLLLCFVFFSQRLGCTWCACVVLFFSVSWLHVGGLSVPEGPFWPLVVSSFFTFSPLFFWCAVFFLLLLLCLFLGMSVATVQLCLFADQKLWLVLGMSVATVQLCFFADQKK